MALESQESHIVDRHKQYQSYHLVHVVPEYIR